MRRWGIAAHIARLRAVVGHELLVRHAGHDDEWGILGGAVDVGGSPAAAAIREAREEIGVERFS